MTDQGKSSASNSFNATHAAVSKKPQICNSFMPALDDFVDVVEDGVMLVDGNEVVILTIHRPWDFGVDLKLIGRDAVFSRHSRKWSLIDDDELRQTQEGLCVGVFVDALNPREAILPYRLELRPRMVAVKVAADKDNGQIFPLCQFEQQPIRVSAKSHCLVVVEAVHCAVDDTRPFRRWNYSFKKLQSRVKSRHLFVSFIHSKSSSCV